jgi:hypothetical protein
VGEIETENKVLVVKRIKQTFHLVADENDREKIERVLKVYADSCLKVDAAGCAVAGSIKGASRSPASSTLPPHDSCAGSLTNLRWSGRVLPL